MKELGDYHHISQRCYNHFLLRHTFVTQGQAPVQFSCRYLQETGGTETSRISPATAAQDTSPQAAAWNMALHNL